MSLDISTPTKVGSGQSVKVERLNIDYFGCDDCGCFFPVTEIPEHCPSCGSFMISPE